MQVVSDRLKCLSCSLLSFAKDLFWRANFGTAVLGEQGRAAVEADARAVFERGEMPLLVILTAPQDNDVTMSRC